MMTRKRYILFPPYDLGLLENTCSGTWRDFFARMSSDGHTPSLYWMLVLPMIPFHANLVPTISFDYLDDISNFQFIACPFHFTAKIIPCFYPGHKCTLRPHHLRRFQHRRHRFHIPCTPANITSQRSLYILFCRLRILLQKGIGSHNKAGGAVAALSCAFFGKSLLDWVQFTILGESLDSQQFGVLGLGHQHTTGVDGVAIQHHTAAAAIPRAANQLCSVEM